VLNLRVGNRGGSPLASSYRASPWVQCIPIFFGNTAELPQTDTPQLVRSADEFDFRLNNGYYFGIKRTKICYADRMLWNLSRAMSAVQVHIHIGLHSLTYFIEASSVCP
jgi:hypothetical protein